MTIFLQNTVIFYFDGVLPAGSVHHEGDQIGLGHVGVCDAAGEVAGQIDGFEACIKGGRTECGEAVEHDDVEQIPMHGGFQFVMQFAARKAVGDFRQQQVFPDVAELAGVLVPVGIALHARASQEVCGEVVRAGLSVVLPFLREAGLFGMRFVFRF